MNNEKYLNMNDNEDIEIESVQDTDVAMKSHTSLEGFLKQNKLVDDKVKYVASKSFVDENGKPIEWIIKPLKSRDGAKIRKVCTKQIGNKTVTDDLTFNVMVATKCTVFPDLNNAMLQDSYGVKGADKLILELLDKDGEFNMYCKKILDISGYNKTDADLIEEAKN